MKENFKLISIGILVLFMLVIGNAQADEEDVNIPITADEAFDAHASQTDPLSGDPATVIIVDVRTKAEHYWVGAPAEVETIVTKSGKEFLPHNGKVKLQMGGRYLKFQVEKGNRLRPVFLPVSKVASIATNPIAHHIPFLDWNEAEGTKDPNSLFADQMNALADLDDDRGHGVVLILMCRSGKRSNTRAFNPDLFKEVYEIDQPDGTNGCGGFEGTNYSSVYNGYRGFAGRYTRNQESPSVSWTDARLPIHIGNRPKPPLTEQGDSDQLH